MMRLLVYLVLLASPVFTSICNLNNCFNIRSSELKSGALLDDMVKDYDIQSTNLLAFTGQVQDSCSIQLECTSNVVNWKTELTIKPMYLNTNIQLKHNPIKTNKDHLNTLVNTTIKRQSASVNRQNSAIDIGLQFHLRDSVFAYYYSEDLKKLKCFYEKLANTKFIGDSAKLLKGQEEGNYESIMRNLSTTDCGDDLTISLCPCLEPVITDLSWDRETETLHCTAASIEGSEYLNITWTENNNTSVQNVTKEFTNTKLTKTSTLNNMTSLEMSRNITCKVSMLSNNVSIATRSITIPARTQDSTHQDGEASKDTDGENTNSQAFLTILITIIVVSVVIVALVCVGVIKLVQRYKDNKTPEPPPLDAVERTAGNSGVDEGAIIHLYGEDRGSGTQIESNYQDLEELLDTVEPRVIPSSDEVPLYTEVNIKKPVEQENIYNRLDPKLMTVNRGDPDRWRTFRPGETGASPHTLGASPHTLGASSNTRMVQQPPVTSAPPVSGTLTQGNNFCPAPEEGLYEMQTLKL